ncbi:hypothetical protein D3C76_1528870 [compost metagenome]
MKEVNCTTNLNLVKMTNRKWLCNVADVARKPPVASAEAADGSKKSVLDCLVGKLVVSWACDRGQGSSSEARSVVAIPVM